MVWAMTPGATIRWGEGSQLAEDWRSVTGDSFIVHAERISGDNLVNSFLEVLKYSLKFSELELGDNFHAYWTLKGKRLLSSCGIWYGLDLPENAQLADDPLDGPYLDLVYRWAGERGYLLVENSALMVAPSNHNGCTDADPQDSNGSHAHAGAGGCA
jgi:hypothetical protein